MAKTGAHGLSSTSWGRTPPLAAVDNPCTHRFRSMSTRCRFRPRQQATADLPSSSVKLAKEELQSLEAVIKANGIPTSDADSTTVTAEEVPASTIQQMLQVISKGKEKEVEDLQQLEGFMLLAEQLHRHQGSSQGVLPLNSPQKMDVWQVCRQHFQPTFIHCLVLVHFHQSTSATEAPRKRLQIASNSREAQQHHPA